MTLLFGCLTLRQTFQGTFTSTTPRNTTSYRVFVPKKGRMFMEYRCTILYIVLSVLSTSPKKRSTDSRRYEENDSSRLLEPRAIVAALNRSKPYK